GPLGAQLARLTGVIDRESARQDLRRLGFEILQRVVERYTRWNRPLNADRVELLEALQIAWLRRCLERGECRQRNELAVRTGDVHLRKLIGRESVGPLDQRDHFVASTLNAESIDVIAA